MNIRREIANALKTSDFDKVVVCFESDAASTLKNLQMYVFGLPHDPMRWHAIEFLGKLAEKYSEEYNDLFRNLIRRFIWQMCEESANVPWASAEVVGSVVANVEGNRYSEFIGPLFYHTGLNDICYAGLFWVLPSLMKYHSKAVLEFLPQTMEWFESFAMEDMRAYAAIYFEQYPQEYMKDNLSKWCADERKAILYVNGEIIEKSVAELSQAAILKLMA